MTVLGLLLSILWIVIIPAFIGAGIILAPGKSENFFVTHNSASLKKTELFMWSWLFGQLLLWCVFQPLTVTEILKKHLFDAVVREYSAAVAVLSVFSGVMIITGIISRRKAKTEKTEKSDDITDKKEDGYKNEIAGISEKKAVMDEKNGKTEKRMLTVFWIVFFIILIIQIVLQAALAYMEVDDSFYVSEAVEAGSSGYMYFKIPYTGITTELDMRHSLEPFPIWLAYIARVTGMNTTVMAHVVLPMLLLPLTYGVYALMGNRLLGKNNRYIPVFMVITEILVLFGYYSSRTPEKFFITRIRQGKSALASFVIPGIILCLFLILEFIKENKKVDFRLWIMLFCLNMSGCLCSTFGAVLSTLPVVICAALIVIMYKKWKHIPGMVIASLPSLIFALLYMILR